MARLLGCVEERVKGDHLIMSRSGMARPVVIKMDKDLGEDIVRGNMRTLGIDRKEFERLMDVVRRESERVTAVVAAERYPQPCRLRATGARTHANSGRINVIGEHLRTTRDRLRCDGPTRSRHRLTYS